MRTVRNVQMTLNNHFALLIYQRLMFNIKKGSTSRYEVKFTVLENFSTYVLLVHIWNRVFCLEVCGEQRKN